MKSAPDYRGVAKVFWSGRSQAVRLPAACRFETTEVEIVKVDDQLTLRPRGKDWRAYFSARSRGSLPAREDLPLDERDRVR
ncbi:MAG: AbrB/MazE/SpoVT family DNA-binding domain-containing protein [Acidobacteria bacterium]|nr:AbrB/MazE/SpoVT family DNA-binding domain-containing protein [Acidobacteriota bacterium]MYD69600.1 AbrB/MazE/SpoVT family DNA-binding domain-containing protein [Acidobacteriota bacterium]MYJ03174.1 AbrB/MazE/SpoVT family DNA-binding domain-containing protein [Acidobacteriota bacterium]